MCSPDAGGQHQVLKRAKKVSHLELRGARGAGTSVPVSPPSTALPNTHTPRARARSSEASTCHRCEISNHIDLILARSALSLASLSSTLSLPPTQSEGSARGVGSPHGRTSPSSITTPIIRTVCLAAGLFDGKSIRKSHEKAPRGGEGHDQGEKAKCLSVCVQCTCKYA